MASVEECEDALAHLGDKLRSVDDDLKRKHSVDRTISCWIPDLGVMFSGHIRDGHAHDVVQAAPPEPAQIRVTVSSDDLIALTHGGLHFTHALATGRLKVEASLKDLLRLRNVM